MAVAKEEGEGRMTPVCQVQKNKAVSLSLYFSFELEMEPRVSCLVGRHGSTEPCCTFTRNSPGVLQLYFHQKFSRGSPAGRLSWPYTITNALGATKGRP